MINKLVVIGIVVLVLAGLALLLGDGAAVRWNVGVFR